MDAFSSAADGAPASGLGEPLRHRTLWHRGPVAGLTGGASAHVQAWQEVIVALRREGWVAEITCSAAPVQIEGRLPGGQQFYFRARHGDATLAVDGDDPSDIPEWERSERHEEASHLPADDGEDIIRRLAGSFSAGDPTEGVT